MHPDLILSYLLGRTLWISAAILFLLLIRPLMRHLPRIGLYVLWIILVVRILCPLDFAGLYRFFPDSGKSASSLQDTVAYGGRENYYRLSPEQKAWLALKNSDAPTQPQPVSEAPQDITRTMGTTAVQDALPFAFILSYILNSPFLSHGFLLLWALGFLLCFNHLMRSLRKDRKALSDATFIGDAIYLHPLLETPFVAGFIHPRIYLPTQLNDTDRAYLLTHERVHIRRHDFRIKPLAYLAFSLLWFNPLGWLAWHLMQKDMEISCDEAVIRRLDTTQRKYYSHLLLTMATGQKHMRNFNTAFGADIIQERILHIMKYKTPTKFLVTMTFVISLLCACGVGSSPAEPTNAPGHGRSDAAENAVYVEQEIGLPKAEDETSFFYYTLLMMDRDRHFVWFGQKYERKTLKLLSYVKATQTDDGWTTKEVGWSDVVRKNLDEQHNHIVHGWYANNGALYIVFSESSINIMKYRQEPEKYQDQYRVSKQHLFRIDESDYTCKEIEVPTGRENANYSTGNNTYITLSNGNYIVSHSSISPDEETDSRIYDGVTDEVIGTTKNGLGKKSVSPIYSGDDFLCYVIYNAKNETFQIEVCDPDGANAYTMDYETSAQNGSTESGMPFALGVCENEIILLTKEGIYHAEYGEETFSKTADCKEENIYYLLMDRYKLSTFMMWVSDRDDFYVMLSDDTSSEKNDFKICHYFKK